MKDDEAGNNNFFTIQASTSRRSKNLTQDNRKTFWLFAKYQTSTLIYYKAIR